MGLVLIQPITEMSTGNVLGGKAQKAFEADNLTAFCEPSV
jgi:hypothetical protein